MEYSERIGRVTEKNVRPYVQCHVDYLKLPGSELAVYLAIKSFAWNHKEHCHPSLNKIALLVNVKKRQVMRAITSLEKKGLIEVERSEGTTREVNNYYLTNIELPSDLSTDEPSEDAPPSVIEDTTPSVIEDTTPSVMDVTLNIKTINNKKYKKSFCLKDQKENSKKKHDWAPMKNEQASIKRNEEFKRTRMPDELRKMTSMMRGRV